jgi:hypothetical protein
MAASSANDGLPAHDQPDSDMLASIIKSRTKLMKFHYLGAWRLHGIICRTVWRTKPVECPCGGDPVLFSSPVLSRQGPRLSTLNS